MTLRLYTLRELTFNQPFEIFIPYQLRINDIKLLEIQLAHTVAIVNLPFYHRDPFDRLIIGQSIVENIPVITADSAFKAYPIQILW
jgi:PIN domain nuclease of toxin-antitoxin system